MKKEIHKPLFKVALIDILTREKREYVPSIVEKCVEFLITNALDVEGIFRMSPNFDDLQDMVKSLDNGIEVDLKQSTDPHVVCGILKKV